MSRVSLLNGEGRIYGHPTRQLSPTISFVSDVWVVLVPAWQFLLSAALPVFVQILGVLLRWQLHFEVPIRIEVHDRRLESSVQESCFVFWCNH